VRHIEEVICLEGGNEYIKGCTEKDEHDWKGKQLKGKLSECQDLPIL
jgi:hypothetical protein